LPELLSQRTFQICPGYEDADDCDHLKNDPALRAAAAFENRGPDGSKKTLVQFHPNFTSSLSTASNP